MPIKKKKKKKEEFDASFMGNYLPGARTPVATVPADALSKVYSVPPIYQWSWRYMPAPGGTSDVHIPEGPPPLARQFLQAWWQYTGIPSAAAGGGTALGLQILSQAPQARWASPFIAFGFFSAWVLEATIGTAVVSLALTIIDPADKWEGGLDELTYGSVHPTTSKDIIMGLGSWGTVV